MPRPNRVMIIGLDGATWDVLDPWIRDGRLPHLGALRLSGSWGNLMSTIPPITAAAWSTFMTGKKPGKHGVFHFVKLFDENGNSGDKPELVSGRSIQSPAVWDVLGHHDRKSVLINIPLTYPPRPVNGVMITGLLTPSRAAVFTYPPELSQQLADYKIDLDRFADKTPFQDDMGAEATAPSLALVEEFRDMTEKRRAWTLRLMRTEPWDFFMVVFTAPDRMGHYLWDYHRDSLPTDDPSTRQLCQAVRDFYVRLDEVIGDLVKEAGPQTRFIIMSDHGMGAPPQKQLRCNNWLQQRGWLVAEPRGGEWSNPDVWLKRLGIPRDKLGRILYRIPGLRRSRLVKKAAHTRKAAADVDRSKAYGVPIFFNIMGVRLTVSGAERESLRGQIMRELRELVDPEVGRRITRWVGRGEDYYAGDHAANVPDIIAVFDPNYHCDYHIGHYSSIVTKRQVTSEVAKHRSQGIFIATGPGIQAQPDPLPDLDIEDIAPTVLYFMDLPVPTDMDGRVITEVVSPAEAQAHPVRHIEPTGYWPSEKESVLQVADMSEEDEAIIRERLQSLGYLE